jgi:hypothetical protein
VTKSHKAIIITLAAVALFLLFWDASSNYFSGIYYRPDTCEQLFRREVILIDKASKECAIAGKPFPTLDGLVAQGLLTLPQDRYENTGGYPINPRDLRGTLYSIYHPHIAYARRVIVTSTKGKCKNGNTLVASSLNSPRELWFESRLTH